jgi:hypothetical protein
MIYWREPISFLFLPQVLIKQWQNWISLAQSLITWQKIWYHYYVTIYVWHTLNLWVSILLNPETDWKTNDGSRLVVLVSGNFPFDCLFLSQRKKSHCNDLSKGENRTLCLLPLLMQFLCWNPVSSGIHFSSLPYHLEIVCLCDTQFMHLGAFFFLW